MEPVSRAYLRGLKAQTDEETRIKFVEHYVSQIYASAKQTARTTTQTSFQQQVLVVNPREETGLPCGIKGHNRNIRNNMSDILARLQSLFPDSIVEFKTLSKGQDGKLYDIADIDERMKPFIDSRHNQDFIIIDWS
jgi:hypothetical protein